MNHPHSRTLPDLLDEIAARGPAREFIVRGGERLSYAETRARQLAKGLLRLGVQRNDGKRSDSRSSTSSVSPR